MRALGIAGAAALVVALLVPAQSVAASEPTGTGSATPAATTAATTAVTPAATTTVTPAATTAQHLAAALAAGRKLPDSDVGALRAGSLRTATVSGTSWAIATFEPPSGASRQVRDDFQDGAGTGVFSRANGQPWRLVATGPYGCGRGLPAALDTAWGLGASPACAATPATQRSAAARALAQAPAATGSFDALRERIARIALGQVGVSDTPVTTSFGLDCNPFSSLVAGFSANSNGCGIDQKLGVRNENEEWCSDFVKWAWQRAGVTADMNTINAGSVSFYQWALDQGQSPQPDAGTPAVGDAVVFFSPGPVTTSSYAIHVGVVTSVNADGTVDMANGDFLGATNISVQYNTNLNLTAFAAAIYGTGEQWVLVSPTPAQHAAPSVRMSAPRRAVSGTAVTFTAAAHEPSGSITRYYWTFGDGRLTNTVGPRVTHVFSGDGVYPVTVTATSGFGTARTAVRSVDVVGTSSAAASVPSDAVWFASTPIQRYRFVRSSSGALAADVFDGTRWLQETAAGRAAAGGPITSLAYPDPAAGDATTPHAYFRSATGTLAETWLGASGWVTRQLPGTPAAGTAIVATTTPAGGVAVFYVTADGRPAVTAGQGASWTASTLHAPRDATPGSLALADSATGPTLVYPAGHGQLVALSAGWPGKAGDHGPVSGHAKRLQAHAAGATPLAAVATGTGGAAVFFVSDTGRLAEAIHTDRGWLRGRPGMRAGVRLLPGRPVVGAGLAATNYLLPSATGPVIYDLPTASPRMAVGTEAFYVTAGNEPAVTYTAGDAMWRSGALPGSATAVTGADAYQVAGQQSRAFLTGPVGPSADSAATPAGPWSAVALPTTPATVAGRVLLYAATPADRLAAEHAAAAAGLAAAQVTTSYAAAWDATLSGNYLVITVGEAATSALYYNVCGWANPSTDIPGTTPFFLAGSPLDSLPGAGGFENGSAATATASQQRATDLAYYAAHDGHYPAGVTAPPPATYVRYACTGSPS